MNNINNDIAKCLNESKKTISEASGEEFVVVVHTWKNHGAKVFGTFASIEDAKKFIEDDRMKIAERVAKKTGKPIDEVEKWYKLETRIENKEYYNDIASWEIQKCTTEHMEY